MIETVIRWRSGSTFKADAVKCYDEIKQLGDEIKPKQVLDLARDSNTELHKCFDWDDSSAAEKYRIYQARNVIGSIVVVQRNVDNEEKEPIQFRVLLKNEKSADSGYKPTILMVRDEDEYKKLLDQAYMELRNFKKKYSCLVELANIIALID